MDALQHIRRLFAYNSWANRRTFDSLQSSLGGVSKALRGFTHLLIAEKEWLLRLEENKDTAGFNFWPELSLAVAGARLVHVPVDREGLDVEAGERLEPRARLVYVTPSHQFPLGMTMSLARRLKLLDWAGRAGAWIVEDDFDSEYRYEGRPLASLQGLDTDGRVIYVGTFSKVLFPSLRLGYMVVTENLVGAFVAARAMAGRHSPSIDQAMLTDFIEEGHFGRHVRRMRALYRGRQAALVEALREECGGLLEPEPTDAGLQLTAWLGQGLGDRQLRREAAARGVEAWPMSLFYTGRPGRPAVVLGYAAFDEGQIRWGAERLAAAARACLAGQRGRAHGRVG